MSCILQVNLLQNRNPEVQLMRLVGQRNLPVVFYHANQNSQVDKHLPIK